MTSSRTSFKSPLGIWLSVAASFSMSSGCGDGEAGRVDSDAEPTRGMRHHGSDQGASGDTGVLDWKNPNQARIPEQIAPEDLAEVFSYTVCSVLGRCRPEVWSDVFPEVRGCVEHFTKVLHDRDFGGLEASVREHKVDFDGQEVARCLEDYLATDCNDLVPERLICAHSMPGRVSTGEACVADFECAPGNHCRMLSCPGICEQKGDLGATCGTGVQCLDGLECVDSRCVTPLPEGASCNPNRDICENGLLCVSLDDLDPRCATWERVYSLDEGEACDPTGGRTCKLGLYCIFDQNGDRLCAPEAEADGPCQLGDPDPCPAHHYCDALRRPPYAGRCRALAEAGESCSSSAECSIDTACVDAFGTSCVPLQPIGGECVVDSACYSGHCNPSLGACEYATCAG